MSSSDINMLTRQKELLLQKLSTFEETNRTLRELLREQHEREVSSAECCNLDESWRQCCVMDWKWDLSLRTLQLFIPVLPLSIVSKRMVLFISTYFNEIRLTFLLWGCHSIWAFGYVKKALHCQLSHLEIAILPVVFIPFERKQANVNYSVSHQWDWRRGLSFFHMTLSNERVLEVHILPLCFLLSSLYGRTGKAFWDRFWYVKYWANSMLSIFW